MKKLLILMCLCFGMTHANEIDRLAKLAENATLKVSGEKIDSNNKSADRYSVRGFFLNKQGYVITCGWFAENYSDLKVSWENNKGYTRTSSASIVAVNKDLDVAILKTPSTHMNFPAHQISFTYPNPLQTVLCCKTDYGYNINYPVFGKILRMIKDGVSLDAMIGICNKCISDGTPILDSAGSVIGVKINCFTHNDYICCVPMASLKEWIGKTLAGTM